MGENNVVKKKKSGIAIFFIVLVSIIILFALALLIRLAIVQDGDYFAPVKKVFGLEDEEESTSKKKKENNKDDEDEDDVDEDEDDEDEDEDDEDESDTKKGNKKNTSKTSGKLSLLSSAATANGVNHYNMTVNVKDFLDMCFEITDEAGYDTKDLIDLGVSYAKEYDIPNVDSYTDEEIEEIENIIDEIIEYCKDVELSADLYSKDNELIQVVLTFEYGDIIEKLYEYSEELDPESVEDYDDYEDFFEKEIAGKLTKDVVIDLLEEGLSSAGLSGSYVTMIEDCIDFVEINGGYELYFTFTDDINDYIAEFVEEYADSIEEEGIDPNNFIDGFVDYINDVIEEEFEEYGYKNIFEIKKVK